MHEFDEICYGKTVEELQKEMVFQMHFGNCEMLTQYIMDCIERLKRENAPTVYLEVLEYDKRRKTRNIL